jgi:hypothetical protein
MRFGSQPMGDFVTKKRTPLADNHLELFSSKTDIGPKIAATGTIEDFCLHQMASEPEFSSESELVVALMDKPSKRQFSKPAQKVIYRIPRKPSARKKNVQ